MRIAMVGTGKLGLPVALAWASKGHDVVGYDVTPWAKEVLAARKYPYIEPGAQKLLEDDATWSRVCMVETVAEAVAHGDLVFVAVQTPHGPEYEGITRVPEDTADFDYSFVRSAVSAVAECAVAANKHVTVVVISTMLPGTSEREVLPIISDEKAKQYVSFAYAPMFIAQSTVVEDALNPEFVLLGLDKTDSRGIEEVTAFFAEMHGDQKLAVMSVASAEACKVAYNCYSDDTEVLTSEGWKLFSDMHGREEVLSLNPETKNIEWARVKRVVKGEKCREMLHFFSAKDDVLVTPDHFMFVGRMVTNKKEKKRTGKSYVYNYRLQQAKDVVKHKHFTFCRSVNWVGSDASHVVIDDGVAIPSELFAEFMGWYCAEGCVSKCTDNSYSIKVSQDVLANPDKHARVVEVCRRMVRVLGHGPESGCVMKNGFQFNDTSLGKYLSRLGGSITRYVPKEVKELAPHYLRIFLDAENNGDGSKQKTKRWANGDKDLVDRKYYSTSSRQMAADIAEIIVKVGRHPSCRQQISNLSGRLNYLVYELTGMTSLYQSSSKVGLKFERVEYSGDTWCVMLDRNHVMLTRRNGKCAWHGNTFLGFKILAANTWMEICHKTGANVDDVMNALKRATDRIVSPKYMSPGMGDGGGCHPRDVIALSHLAERLDLSFDLGGTLALGRERQTQWLADLVIDETCEGKLPVVVLGKAYKRGTNLCIGSPAILLKNILDEVQALEVHQWDPHVDVDTPDYFAGSEVAAVFVVATDHDEFFSMSFPQGSTVVDPWGKVQDRDGVKVVRVGRR